MVHEKFIALFAATVIGAALIAAPAAARGGGHGGGGHGGGGHGGGAHAGSGSHGGGSSIGVARVSGLHTGSVGVARRHVVVHRAFFPRHRVFVRPFVGYGLYADYSCWRWVPTPFGLRRVWACDYPYGPY